MCHFMTVWMWEKSQFCVSILWQSFVWNFPFGKFLISASPFISLKKQNNYFPFSGFEVGIVKEYLHSTNWETTEGCKLASEYINECGLGWSATMKHAFFQGVLSMKHHCQWSQYFQSERILLWKHLSTIAYNNYCKLIRKVNFVLNEI